LADPTTTLQLTDCTVDLARAVVVRDGQSTRLTEREVALLAYLVDRPDQVVGRDELLAQVWQYAPSVVTRAVDNTVGRLRLKIEPPGDEPVHLQTVRGEGYRLTLPSPRTVAGPGFSVGRDEDLAHLNQALARCRLVTLVGPSGVGKTHLARRLAAQQRPPGWFCELSGVQSALAMGPAVADALGLRGGGSVGQRLASRGPLLLVLDNFEQLDEAASDEVAAWLREAPELRLLVTSRRPLQLRDELLLRLEPLSTAAGVALFQHRTHTPVAAAEVEALVDELDCLPLALELAAARTSVLSVGQIRARLAEQLDLLRSRYRDAPPRHLTLRAAITWSWDLLGDEDRGFLASSAVFAGPFTLEAATAVLGPAALDRVESLVLQSLVQRVHTDPPRFRLLHAIRLFAAEQGVPPDTVSRHQRHFLDPIALDRSPTMESLAREHLEYWAIWDRVGAADRGRAALALHPSLVLGAPTALHLDVLEAAESDAAAWVRVRALRLIATLHRGRGQIDAGLEVAGRAVAVAEAHSLWDDLASSIAVVASMHHAAGDMRPALAEYERALEQARPHTLLWCEMARSVGIVRRMLGDTEGALASLEQAAEAARVLGDLGAASRVANSVGNLHLTEGDVEAGREALQQAAQLARRAGAPSGELAALANLGRIEARELGCAALPALNRALALSRRLGDRRIEGHMLARIGVAHAVDGLVESAIGFYQRALVLHVRLMDRVFEGSTEQWWANALHEQGRLEEAQGHYDRALVCSRMTEDDEIDVLLLQVAVLAVQRGDREAAALAVAEARTAGAHAQWVGKVESLIEDAPRRVGDSAGVLNALVRLPR
jgi:DNA-binding winged helix-turn-helix (wHTH) protein/tetratricopeptide (TPR) repeat protein